FREGPRSGSCVLYRPARQAKHSDTSLPSYCLLIFCRGNARFPATWSALLNFTMTIVLSTPTCVGRIGKILYVASGLALAIAAILVTACSGAEEKVARRALVVISDDEQGWRVFQRLGAACQALGLQRRGVVLEFVGTDITDARAIGRTLDAVVDRKP